MKPDRAAYLAADDRLCDYCDGPLYDMTDLVHPLAFPGLEACFDLRYSVERATDPAAFFAVDDLVADAVGDRPADRAAPPRPNWFTGGAS